MSEKTKNQTLFDQVQEEQMFPNRVEIDTAQLMAEAVKEYVDKRAEYQAKRKHSRGILGPLKKLNYKSYERTFDKAITREEDNVSDRLRLIEARQSSYLCQRFYNYVGERAKQLGMEKLAEELAYEQSHTPTEVYEHLKGFWEIDHELSTEQLNKFYQERTMRDVVVASANVLVSTKESIMKVCELSTGNGFGEYNPLTRAVEGFGAQSETHADLSDVYKLIELLGFSDKTDLPRSLPEMNHFGLAFPVLTSSLSKHKAFNIPEYRDTDFNLNYQFRYRPEKMRSSGEDVVYIPDELYVYITKSPGYSEVGGRREEAASELGEQVAVASEA